MKYRCPLCADEGVQRDDDGAVTDYCDCATGESLREALS